MRRSLLLQYVLPLVLAFGFSLAASPARGQQIALNAGDLDPSFGGDGRVTTDFDGNTDVVAGMVVQEDGNIVVTGHAVVNDQDFALARYLSDGALDATFDPVGLDGMVTTDFGGEDKGQAVAIAPGGDIIVVGFTDKDDDGDFAIARYDPGGTLDWNVTTDFGGRDWALAVTVQENGKIVVAGVTHNGGEYDFAVARYLGDGTPDPTFGPASDGIVITPWTAGSNDLAYGVAVEPNGMLDGNIVVAGHTDNGDGNPYDFALARYLPDGTLDTTFDPIGFDGMVTTDFGGRNDEAYAMTLQADGKIVLAGSTANYQQANFALARYRPDGSLDAGPGGFGAGTGKVTTDFASAEDIAYAVTLQADGKIIAAGHVFDGSNHAFGLVRYLPNGTPDGTFGVSGKVKTDFEGLEQSYTVAVQPDGKIVAAGYTNAGSNEDFAVARYLGIEDCTPGGRFRAVAANALAIQDGLYLGVADPDDTNGDGFGPDANMACQTLNITQATSCLRDFWLKLGINHNRLGDLVVKLRSPGGIILAPLHRSGITGLPDDGTFGLGDDANLLYDPSDQDRQWPIAFRDNYPFAAEAMGSTLLNTNDVVCKDDGECSFEPNPDDAYPGSSVLNFAAYNGINPNGTWTVCVGDANAGNAPRLGGGTVATGGDDGVFESVSLTVEGDGPACPLAFNEAGVSPATVAPGGSFTVSGNVANDGPGPRTARLELQYSRVGGGPSGTLVLGQGIVPQTSGVPFSVNRGVPSNAPPGTYDLTLLLVDVTSGETCSSATTTLTVVPARETASTAEGTTLVEPAAPSTMLFGSASAAASEDGSVTVAVSPNPFAGRTQISYAVAVAADVRLSVYDVLGREVAVLVDGRVEARAHSAAFDGRGLASGVYVYRLVVGSEVLTGRMTLAR